MGRFGWVLNLGLGLALLIGGSWLLVYELQHPPAHSGHVYVLVGVALLGALLINPTPIISGVKQVVIVVAPIIPWSKEMKDRRRASTETKAASDEPEPRP